MSRFRRILARTLAAFGAAGVLLAGVLAPSTAVADDDVNVEAFRYESWHSQYDLSLDDDGRVVAEVTETLVARFPDIDQNRGIVRGLPMRYQGAPAAPEDIEVTDENGDPVPFDVEQQDGFRVVLTGDDDYVHGFQTYVIDYTLHDVIAPLDEGASEEFYWDLVPSDRLQPIMEFSADISFASGVLSDGLTGSSTCYGGGGCTLSEETVDGAHRFSVDPVTVNPYNGVTVAVGLTPGTVTQPPQRLPSFALDVLPVVLAAIALVTAVTGSIVVTGMRRRRARAHGAVVAQYDVPADLPPVIAAPIANGNAAVPAQIVHLAVNGVIRVEEGGSGKKGATRPKLRVADAGRASDPLDRDALSTVFGGAVGPDSVVTLRANDSDFAKRVQTLGASGRREAISRGYLRKESSRVARWLGGISLLLLVPVLVLVLVGLSREGGIHGLVYLVAGFFTMMFAVPAMSRHVVHTPKGAEARAHLLGVREFIRVAEADRLSVLQSYTGAERRRDDEDEVVHLYERLLPYAMIFGQEKQWAKVLEVRYADAGTTSPVWYPGLLGASGDVGSGLSQFTGSLSSAASVSSSSGGAAGGGSVGGGGGGGFAGGR